MINIARLWNQIYRQYLPVLVLLYLGFLEYGFSYLFCMKKLHHELNHHSVAVGLIVLFNLCLACLLASWGLIHVVGNGVVGVKVRPYDLNLFYENGKQFALKEQEQQHPESQEKFEPVVDRSGDSGISAGSNENTLESSTSIHGKATSIPPNENSTDYSNTSSQQQQEQQRTDDYLVQAPDFFICDKDGLPTWCNECNSIKVLRSRHSKYPSTYIHKPGQCIAKMDHYCTYIGHMIGGANYIYFLWFVVSFTLVFVVTLIPIFCYFSKIGGSAGGGGPYHGNVHPVLIIIIIVNLTFVLITLNLIGTCAACVLWNDTLLDKLNLNRLMKLERKLKATKRKQGLNKNQKRTGLFSCFGGRGGSNSGRRSGPSVEELEADIEYCKRYVSVKHPLHPEIRMILPVNMKKDHPFNNGIWKNFKESFKSLEFDNVDELMKYECGLVSESYRKKLIERIGGGEGWVFGSTNVTPVDVDY